jgi:serine/threonine-protein kinase PknK
MSEGFEGASPWPLRYRLLRRLGAGGGGQVWAAFDRATGAEVALKGLNEGSGGSEAAALIQEVTALSGLEGLGFPRVLAVGRGSDGRPYLVRELVAGRSFERTLETEPERAIELLPEIADALTVVHRAGLLHGDVKPGNVVVRDQGGIALVDLGLSTVFREGGVFARGLTPRFAAPEVRRGEPLTAQAEVYALGVMLELGVQALKESGQASAPELERIVQTATAEEAEQRFPSADEFAVALRRALGILERKELEIIPWPVLGAESAASSLRRALASAGPRTIVSLEGPTGSGRSTLLRRIGWELALESSRAILLEAEALDPTRLADVQHRELLEALISPLFSSEGVLLLDGDLRELSLLTPALERALAAGARVVQVVGPRGDSSAVTAREIRVEVPELDMNTVRRLLRGALPGFPAELVSELVQRVSARPLALRSFVMLARGRVLASPSDIDEIWVSRAPTLGAPQLEFERALERGRYGEAARFLEQLDASDARSAWLLARYQNVAGTAARAAELCEAALKQPNLSLELRARLQVTLGRARLGQSRWPEALECLADLAQAPLGVQAEGLAYRGLVHSFCGDQEQAERALAEAEAMVGEIGPRLGAIVWSCLATVEWRSGRAEPAALAYTKAITAATEAGDAGTLASAQINLAGLRKVQGDLARSIELLEAATEAATSAGRTASVQQALLNLTNLDVYLGRLERARVNLERLEKLGPKSEQQEAQMLGLRADVASRLGETERALQFYRACEDAWTAQNRPAEAAEAALEGLLTWLGGVGAPGGPGLAIGEADVEASLARGRGLLGEKVTPLLCLAEARALAFRGENERAEARAGEAKTLSLETGQREWAWRALSLEAELLEQAGRHTRARRARLEATEILEEIGARLPGDLREVYWNDPRRRAVREEATEYQTSRHGRQRDLSSSSHLTGSDVISRLSQTPLERRLAKILAVNSDLASETSFDVLATKILLHATELLGAERGYLLLGAAAEELAVVASRSAQGVPHREFSRSVAAEVWRSRTPFFSVDAGTDQRLARFESVHHAALTAVACVPILSPAREPVGALYVETRARVERGFADEIPTLQAFADQAAIAIGWSRLVEQLFEKTSALEEKNTRLVEAQTALKAVLAERTERLHDAKKKLNDTRTELGRGVGYGGLVGSSSAMRRLYALIDRVRATDVPVLITGESGTGKEVIARAIHEGSPRKKAKMLAVNCGAIPENLLESELFGHVRGAFTGADRDRRGLFQEAKGGTLLLDEIGETPLKMQAALLRVLQEQKVRPVGGGEEVPIDVRVLFATNRDLGQAVREGKFREDLLYRIQVVEVTVPALRERREDIPLLIDHFLGRCALRFFGPKRSMTRDAVLLLMDYDWPGNVRQLENAITNACVLAEDEVISAADINLPSRHSSVPRSLASRPGAVDSVERPRVQKKGTLSEHDREERGRIVEALDKTGWNRARAAEVLGMPRRTFYRRLREYGLQ